MNSRMTRPAMLVLMLVMAVASTAGSCNPLRWYYPTKYIIAHTQTQETDSLYGVTYHTDPSRYIHGELTSSTSYAYATSVYATTSSSTTDPKVEIDGLAVPGNWEFWELNGPCFGQGPVYNDYTYNESNIMLTCKINTGYNNSQYVATGMDGLVTDYYGDYLGSATDLGTSRLDGDDQMGQAEYLKSPNNDYQLLLQTDGNLVLYYQGVEATWATSTSNGAHLIMQLDGNLVLYDSGWSPVWASGTAGNSGAHVQLQDDGNLVVYSATNSVLWALW